MLMTKEDEPLGSRRRILPTNDCLLSVNNYRPVQVVGDRKVLEVLTVQQLEKGSHSGPGNYGSQAGSIRGVIGILGMALMAFL